MGDTGEPRDYLVPCYRVAGEDPWFHFLHGNVPGHEIDFIYRPEVPQGPLGRQHYSHLARLLSYIEPHGSAGYAFTIGNLSRDDIQHEPGHGGLALIFGLRVRGATDHAGRPDPPFAHAVAIIDRALDAPVLLEAAATFHRRVLDDAASAEWYRSYVRSAAEAPAETERVLAGYVAGFGALPRPAPSALSLAWTTGGVAPAGRVVFVYPDDAPFDLLAGAAARIAAVLYRSNVRWSAISSGREADLPNGVTVRFLPESAVGRGDAAAALHRIEAIPADEEAIARELFGATPVRARLVVPGWRDRPAVAEAPPSSSERATSPALEAPASAPEESFASLEETPPGPPAPMVPIPVPLPLVEPPPLVSPSARTPAAPRRSPIEVVAVAACLLAALLAVVFVVFEGGRARPVVTAAATAPPIAPADDVASAAPEGTVAPSTVTVAAPSPASEPKEAAKPAARPGRRGPARTAKCGDLRGRPCF